MPKITLLDGGMSRELERCGATLRQPEWSALALIEAPQTVRAAHDAFLAAGADVITTNTYAVVPLHIGEERFAAEGRALITLAARLAREAADARPGARVAGCLPPACGSYQPETFDPTRAREILAILVDAQTPFVDFWLAETMSSVQEAETTATAVAASDKPLWMSFNLRDPGVDEPAGAAPVLRSGEPVEAACALVSKLGADAMLFNCSQPEAMPPAIEIARRVLREHERETPIGVYANAFAAPTGDRPANEVILAMREDLDPDGYHAWARRWVDAGATIIGGCCGVVSPHIASLNALRAG